MGPRAHWSKDPPKTKHPINARVETVTTSGMFRGAFARRDGQPMAFTGLGEGYRWLDGTALRTFAIITTTTANAEMTGLHDSMP
jgi:putative SOS response-associated peptidase YedK